MIEETRFLSQIHKDKSSNGLKTIMDDQWNKANEF